MDIEYPISGEDSEDQLFKNNEDGQDGFFPVGENRFWHGGVHLYSDKPIVAVRDGSLVAYRINKKHIQTEFQVGGPKFNVSAGFVLLHHETATPLGNKIVFYSLYMHLLPVQNYLDDPDLIPPIFLRTKRPLKVDTARDGAGINIRDDSSPSNIVGVIPRDAVFELAGGPVANKHWSKEKGFKGHIRVRWSGMEGWALVNIKNSREEKGSDAWVSTAIVRVFSGEDPAKLVGEIPAGEKFDAKVEPPTDPSWSKEARRARFHKVSFGKVQGYAWLEGIALAAQRRLTAGDDKPKDPSKMGLAVRKESEIVSPVIRILPKGTLAYFKDPLSVRIGKTTAFHELKDGGFIPVDKETMSEEIAIQEPDKYDLVRYPAKPMQIHRGDPLGYTGSYPVHGSSVSGKLVHFEIFADAISFMEEKEIQEKNEHWFCKKAYHVKSGAVFKKREPIPETDNPKIDVSLPIGAKLRVSERYPGSPYVRVFRHEVQGWRRISELGDLFQTGYHVDRSPDPLLERLPACWCKEPEIDTVETNTVRGDYLEIIDRNYVSERYKLVRYNKKQGWAKEHDLGDFYAEAFYCEKGAGLALKNKPGSWTAAEETKAAERVAIAEKTWVRPDAEAEIAEVFHRLKGGWAPERHLGALDPKTRMVAPTPELMLYESVPKDLATMRSAKKAPGATPGPALEDTGEKQESKELWVNVTFRDGESNEVKAWVRKAELGEKPQKKRYVLMDELPALLAQAPKRWAGIKDIKSHAIDAKQGEALEYLDKDATAREEYQKLALRGSPIMGWKRSALLHDWPPILTNAPRHFVLSSDIGSLLASEPKQVKIDAKEGEEVAVIEEAKAAGTDYLRIRHGKKAGWWPKAELGTEKAGKRTLTGELVWILQDKPKDPPEELKVTALTGDLLAVLDIKGAYAKVNVIVTVDAERWHGWTEASDLYVEQVNPYRKEALPNDSSVFRRQCYVKNQIKEFFSYDPHSTFQFVRDAGKNSSEVVFDDTGTKLSRDKQGHNWAEVSFDGKSGWIGLQVDPATRKFSDPNVSAVSDYSWEAWQKISEETSKKASDEFFSDDGLCDVTRILEQIDKGGKLGLNLEHDAIKKALTPKFHTLVCLHPSEWDTSDKEKKYGRLRPVLEKNYEPAMKHIDHLQFWSELAGNKKVPSSPKVWHPHPIGFLSQLQKMKGITADQLKRIYPGAKDADIQKYVGPLNEAMEKWEINTPLLQAHFLAQFGVESAELSSGEEGIFYGRKGDPNIGEDYEARYDLDNIRPGDGQRFKGRGLIQLTGRGRYSLYGAYIQKDLTANHTILATDPRLACDVSGWFWRRFGKDINTVATAADDDTVTKVTYCVNGPKLMDNDKRIIFFHNAKHVLGIS